MSAFIYDFICKGRHVCLYIWRVIKLMKLGLLDNLRLFFGRLWPDVILNFFRKKKQNDPKWQIIVSNKMFILISLACISGMSAFIYQWHVSLYISVACLPLYMNSSIFFLMMVMMASSSPSSSPSHHHHHHQKKSKFFFFQEMKSTCRDQARKSNFFFWWWW